MQAEVTELAKSLMLGELLERVRDRWGSYELLEHWQQGEFHHDTVIQVRPKHAMTTLSAILVIATNCNGGVKEVLGFPEKPDRLALWHYRCPENPEFQGALPPVLGAATTLHWFNPCELLNPDARSELREEHRERQCGGGWVMKKPS